MNNDCPSTNSGKHLLAGNFADVKRITEFEPVNFGDSAAETLYRRVEYSVTTCQCGYAQRRKIVQVDYNHGD